MADLRSQAASSLRGRRRVTTELDIELAALAEFESCGFEQVTMVQIARAAGVSERTAFRYFPAKVDTILHTAHLIATAMESALDNALAAGAELLRAERAIAAVLEESLSGQDGAADRLRRARGLALADPALLAEVAKAEVRGSRETAADISLEHRLIRTIIAATLSATFDDWASHEIGSSSSGSGARLVENYRLARTMRPNIVA